MSRGNVAGGSEPRLPALRAALVTAAAGPAGSTAAGRVPQPSAGQDAGGVVDLTAAPDPSPPRMPRLRGELVAAAAAAAVVPGVTGESDATPELRRSVRRRRPGRLVRAAAVACVFMVTMAGASIMHDPEPAVADVTVRVDDDMIVVSVPAAGAAPESVAAAAQVAGVQLTVQAAPAGPSQVGAFVSYVAAKPGQVQLVHDASGAARTVRIDRSATEVAVTVGVPAAPGELFATPSNATARGEVLGCVDVVGLDRSRMQRVVESAGVAARWSVNGIMVAGVDAVPSDAVVVTVAAISDSSVIVHMTAPSAGWYASAGPSPASASSWLAPGAAPAVAGVVMPGCR